MELFLVRMSDRDVLCKGRLSNKHLSKKCSRRAVIVKDFKITNNHVNKKRECYKYNIPPKRQRKGNALPKPFPL